MARIRVTRYAITTPEGEYIYIDVPTGMKLEFDTEKEQYYLDGRPIDVLTLERKLSDLLAYRLKLKTVNELLKLSPEELLEIYGPIFAGRAVPSLAEQERMMMVPMKSEKPTRNWAKELFKAGIWKVEWGSPQNYGIESKLLLPLQRPQTPYDWAFAYYGFWDHEHWGPPPTRKPPEYDLLP